MYYLCFNWTINAKLLKENISDYRKKCSWLPRWLDGLKIWSCVYGNFTPLARTHRFATIQNVTDRRRTDRRDTVP